MGSQIKAPEMEDEKNILSKRKKKKNGWPSIRKPERLFQTEKNGEWRMETEWIMYIYTLSDCSDKIITGVAAVVANTFNTLVYHMDTYLLSTDITSVYKDTNINFKISIEIIPIGSDSDTITGSFNPPTPFIFCTVC